MRSTEVSDSAAPDGDPDGAAPEGDAPVLPLDDALARVTGLALVPLLVVYVTSIVLRSPEQVDTLFLRARWENPLWLLADWGLLAVGTLHAVLAIRVRWRDAPLEAAHPEGEVPQGRWAERWAQWRTPTWAALAAFTSVLFVAASWAMLILV